MASRKGGRRVVRDVPDGIHITPGAESVFGTGRESEVRIDERVVDYQPPSGILVAVKVDLNQRIAKFRIKQPRGWYDPTDVTDSHDCVSKQCLRDWDTTAADKRWAIFYLPSDKILARHFRTQFRLDPKHAAPQEIRWVAVPQNEGFCLEHRVDGTTWYPRAKAKRKPVARRRAKAKKASRPRSKKSPKR